MLEYVIIFVAGGAFALYHGNTTFRTKVKELATHIKSLFNKPAPPTQAPLTLPAGAPGLVEHKQPTTPG